MSTTPAAPGQDSGVTDALGSYSVSSLAAGTYYPRTFHTLGYVDELYDNIQCTDGCSNFTSGTGVIVTAGQTTSGIDFGLAVGGTITGTVTNATTGSPLSGVSVVVYTTGNSQVGYGLTNGAGVYVTAGIPTGTYIVRTANALGYVDEIYDDISSCPGGGCTGTPVNVTAGTTTGNINFGLALGGTITGTVVDATSEAPLAGVQVYLTSPGSGFSYSTPTNASGVYAKTGLAEGTYYVWTVNALGYLDELYNNIPCPGGTCTVTGGTGVSVTAGTTTTGINFGLTTSGSISGTVTDASSGAVLAGAGVAVYNSSGGFGGYFTTNASGVYTAGGLATGSYYVRTSNALGYVDELYDNLTCAGLSCSVTTGTPVSVTTGATTSGIDFALGTRGKDCRNDDGREYRGALGQRRGVGLRLNKHPAGWTHGHAHVGRVRDVQSTARNLLRQNLQYPRLRGRAVQQPAVRRELLAVHERDACRRQCRIDDDRHRLRAGARRDDHGHGDGREHRRAAGERHGLRLQLGQRFPGNRQHERVGRVHQGQSGGRDLLHKDVQ